MEIVKARLRKGKDDDIKEGMKNLPPYYDHSDFVRDALRLLLFGGKEIKNGNKLIDVEVLNEEVLALDSIEISDEELESRLDGLLGNMRTG